MAEIAEPLAPGRALDLGCGEGADTLWLAQHGWNVVGVDISDTALARAADEAAARGLTDRVHLVQMNLSEAFPEGAFDLISAQFLQSMVDLDRERIFASAARAVAPGGLLVVVDHAEAPSWAEHVRDHVFPTVDEVLDTIDLGEGQWERVDAGVRRRDAVGPDGQAGVLADNVIVLKRSA